LPVFGAAGLSKEGMVVEPSAREKYRYFLKDSVRLTIDFAQTDQNRGVAPPPVEKPFSADAKRIALVPPAQWTSVQPVDLTVAIRDRASHRRFDRRPLSLDELSFLLWATQGVREHVSDAVALRTVPSAGCRHALETYLCVLNVEGLESAFYRYLPVEHQLLFEFAEERVEEKLNAATLGQSFIAAASVVFVWTTIPYRMEWRYDLAAHKVIALDAGHVCQNLYLACQAVGAGTCAIAAYHQELMDRLLRIDGDTEFTLYLAPVGKR
jgi:SagB-type dehydrogenase family enzyme